MPIASSSGPIIATTYAVRKPDGRRLYLCLMRFHRRLTSCLIVINGDNQTTARCYSKGSIIHRREHVTSMMKNTPRVNNVKLT